MVNQELLQKGFDSSGVCLHFLDHLAMMVEFSGESFFIESILFS